MKRRGFLKNLGLTSILAGPVLASKVVEAITIEKKTIKNDSPEPLAYPEYDEKLKILEDVGIISNLVNIDIISKTISISKPYNFDYISGLSFYRYIMDLFNDAKYLVEAIPMLHHTDSIFEMFNGWKLYGINSLSSFSVKCSDKLHYMNVWSCGNMPKNAKCKWQVIENGYIFDEGRFSKKGNFNEPIRVPSNTKDVSVKIYYSLNERQYDEIIFPLNGSVQGSFAFPFFVKDRAREKWFKEISSAT